MRNIIRTSTLLLFILSTHLYANGFFYIQDTLKNPHNFPKMELFLGDVGNGQKMDRSDLTLNVRVVVGENLSKNDSIQIEKWMVSIEGYSIPFTGSGNTLTKEVIKEIKQAKEGSKITISVIIYGVTASAISSRPLTSTFFTNPNKN